MRDLFLLLVVIVAAAALPCVAQPDYEDYENEDLAWMRGTGGGPTNRIIAHPDGRRIIIARTNIQILDLESGDVVKMLYGPENGFTRCDMTSDGRLLATAGGGYVAMIWETTAWEAQWRKHTERAIHSIAISSDARHVALGMDSGHVEVWEWATDRLVRTYRVRTLDTTDPRFVTEDVRFLPNSDTLIGMGFDGYFTAWDVSQDEVVWEYTPPPLVDARYLTLSPDGTHFAFCQTNNRIIEVDADNGFDTSTVVRLIDYNGEGLAYSPDGRYLAMPSKSNDWVHIWETGEFTDRALTEDDAQGIRPPFPEVRGFAYGVDNGYLYAGNGLRGGLAEVSIESDASYRFIGEYWGRIRSIAWSPDGSLLVGSSGDFTFVHDASPGAKGQVLAELVLGRLNLCESMAFSPDQSQLAVGCRDSLRVWTTGVWERWSKSIWVDTFHIYDVQWSADQRFIAIETANHIRMYDFVKDEIRIHFEQDSMVNDFAFTPDSRFLLGVTNDAKVRVWDVSDGQLIHELDDHEQGIGVTDIAISADGSRFVTGNVDGEVMIWSTELMQPIHRLTHRGLLHVVDITPDGSFVLSGGETGVIMIWDAETGDSVGAYREQPFPITEMSISPDGTSIAWGSFDGLFVYHARWKQSGVEHGVRSGADGLHLGAITPNPARDHAALDFTITGAAGRAVPLRVELFDERGERLAVVTDEMVEPGAHSARLETAGLPSGTYVVRVTSGELNVSTALQVVR